MIAKILKIIIVSFLLYLAILTFQFFLLRLAFPDPTVIYLREGLTPEAREIIKRSFGLDKPLYIQYFLYISNFLRGDMGYSFLYKTPVRDIIVDRLLNSLILILPAILVAYVAGRYLGSYIAIKRGSMIEKISVSILSFTNSLPLFWVGMLAIIVFSVNLGLTPIGGMRTPPYEAKNFLEKIASLDFLHHWILPFTVLTIYYMVSPTFLMRSSVINALEEDFVSVMRAVGFQERKILREVSRYSMIPLVTQMGVTLGLSFAGSVAFETIFSWPGIGRELIIAFNNLDFPLIQGVFAVMSLAVIAINSIIDLLYSILDPRTRSGRSI